MIPFREKLKNTVIVFDGALGTMFYAKGVYLNTCFDELNLTAPHMVQQIHQEYIQAGADAVETNTFGASSFKLEGYGLVEKQEEIHLAGVRLARAAAGPDRYVAGAIGPMGAPLEPLGRINVAQAREDFKRRCRALVKGGVDLIILETFIYLDEIELAIKALREECELPIIAQLVLGSETQIASGTPLTEAIDKLASFAPDVIGFNCAVGPKEMLGALEQVVNRTNIPFSLMPNAGMPKFIDGRTIYLTSPEYLAEYAKRFIQTGAHIVGGCCGTTPDHIKAVRRAVSALQPPTKRIDITPITNDNAPEVRPLARPEKSRLAARLSRGAFVTICELVSPRGISATRELIRARQLAFHGVDAINIPDGPRASSRMSALALALLIQREIGIEACLHYTCRDRNIIGMQSDLLGAWALGIRNILAVTGDPPKLGNYPNATAVFDIDAIGLVSLLSRLNFGLDLAGHPIGDPTGFHVAVGVNPGAINLDEELDRLERKIEAGAEMVITQPVFDLDLFERFYKRIEPLRVPLIAGIWPLVSLRNAEFLNNEVPGAHVPEAIMQKLRAATSKDDALKIGAAAAKEMLQQLQPHTNGVQIAVPFGKVDMVLEILETVLC
ncbi:MAG: bifunctional homocysteine S-methyltransferase/methylenetetrahydrofolate reductase [Deltaproteobacteria bacterium]|nr:bifunctional homocysteine S-methyltransferase/methylenetetrahydrofolate reductase [Deltaproteobacteria bacterium]